MNGTVRLSLCALLLSVLACGTLEISVDRTPTPDVYSTGTLGALQAQNADLATKIAALNSTVSAVTNTPLPQPTRTTVPPTLPALPAATRITFLNGATVGVVNAPIQAAQSQSYVLKALKAQPMFVFVGSANNDVTVSIKTQDGTNILSEAARQTSWQGSLPQTGDYFLTIHGGASTENFSLTVTVPLRIVFAAGAVSGTVNGNTVAGYGVSYALFAGKGQDMNVDLENLSSKASLSIYGFTDGQRYLRSDKGQTSFHFKLPSTQDYIIVVTPTVDNEVSFTLTIKIQ
jgi:hypothetical protein